MADSGRNTKLEGTAYGRSPAHSNELLAKVGPGAPCGELMRRYWQPLLPSDQVTNRPREVRILGEDLIAFVPSHYDRYYIGWLESGGAFGTCDVSSHPAKKGTVFIGAHA